ncbi:hypothetical protein HU200_024743 [Digitaria exilis]|uniref:Reverse transcriptase Ty1/copia-type domain-containing protein n=1 Tax=Digitaria exilis TaxID=1010633 RepID=A0A835EWC8_9POAL|nr:hypothetical protein HU200_024743 [Digitaria exilis]
MSLPAGHRPIGLKWVYKVKKNAAGEVVKHKARLVAKGYVQQPGVDYDEAFAPVARIESVRLLLALAAQEGWEVHHMDVKSAFLNGDLLEEVYVKQPDGFVVKGQEEKVLRLDKALYGLRQAPRAWNTKLDQTLMDLKFQRCDSDHSVNARGQGSHRLLVGVYVDDLVITGNNNSEIVKFKLEMKAKFQMSDLAVCNGLMHARSCRAFPFLPVVVEIGMPRFSLVGWHEPVGELPPLFVLAGVFLADKDDDEQVERFYALFDNIWALRGGGGAYSPSDGGGERGERKRLRTGEPPWRPAFRLQDFEEPSPTTPSAGDDAAAKKTHREDDGARPAVASSPPRRAGLRFDSGRKSI